MPDYNPAVALGIKPPENNLAQTYNTIANIQQSQAHTGLYTLEEAKLARENSALAAAAEAYRSGQDPTPVYLSNLGDPGKANQFQSLFAGQRAMAVTPNNLMPGAYEQLVGAAKGRAEIGKIGAETQKIGIETQTAGLGLSKAQDEAALRSANMFLASGDPQHLADAMDAHMKAHPPVSNMDRAYQLKVRDLALKAPLEQQQNIARGYGAIDPTEAQRNAAASGLTSPIQYETAKKTADFDVTQYGNIMEGLRGQANTSAAMLPNIQLAKSLINDPGFYSGTAEGVNLAFKKAAAALGVSKEDAAVPQEAFRKVMAANILHQIDDLKSAAKEMGSSTSRIFAPQIELMEKAAQNPDNTVAGNRFLAEVQERAAYRAIKIGDMAADYKGGHLDEGFIKQLRKWSVDNPMFTKEELSNPKLLARPPGQQTATQFREGQTATNPTTKERMVFQGGKWVPQP